MSIEELEKEIERLKSKNAELLDEKKAAKAKADELADQVAQIEQDRDQARKELHRATVEQPRREAVEQIAADGMAKPLLREIEEQFTIGESGELYDQEGEPILKGEEPVRLDPAGIVHLQQTGAIPSAMIKQNAGSGAKGMERQGASTEKTEQKQGAPTRKFGMR